MKVRFLIPRDPLAPQQPEENYAEEYQAAREAGFSASLFDFDSIALGDLSVRPRFEEGETIVYRGWMMTPETYKAFHSLVESPSRCLITSPDEFKKCHYLPEWLQDAEGLTAETIVFPEEDNPDVISTELQRLDWTGCFIKDYVKSNSDEIGSIARTLDGVGPILEKLILYRGEIEGGICARRIEEFRPGSERRFFVLHGIPHATSGEIPQIVKTIAERIQCPFFTVDIAERADGEMRIIELGDGQVSDKKDWHAEQIVAMFSALAKQGTAI